MTTPTFRARGLVRRFRGPRPAPFAAPTWTTALNDVDIDIDAGARVGIIGESGSGKSTLVRVLLGLDAPTAGTVEFDGRRVDARGRARQLLHFNYKARTSGHLLVLLGDLPYQLFSTIHIYLQSRRWRRANRNCIGLRLSCRLRHRYRYPVPPTRRTAR